MQNNNKVVVVGVGLWGRNLVRVFAGLGVLSGICDLNLQAVKESLASLEKEGLANGVQRFTWQEVLQDEKVAAVVLAVPVRLHKEMTIVALEAGKHVWVEKPMVTTVAAAEEIVAAAKLADRMVMVNHLMRYHTGVEKLLSLVTSGRLGRVWRVETVRKAPGRVFTDADAFYDLMPHDMSVVRALATSLEPAFGGGDILDFGGHGGSVIVADSVAANTADSGQLDWASAYLLCKGGAKITLEVARLYPEKQQRIIVQAVKGMLVFDDRRAWSEKLTYYSHEIALDSKEGAKNGVVLSVGGLEAISLVEKEPLESAARHFVSVIQGQELLRTSAEDARKELILLEKIKQTMYNKV